MMTEEVHVAFPDGTGPICAVGPECHMGDPSVHALRSAYAPWRVCLRRRHDGRWYWTQIMLSLVR